MSICARANLAGRQCDLRVVLKMGFELAGFQAHGGKAGRRRKGLFGIGPNPARELGPGGGDLHFGLADAVVDLRDCRPCGKYIRLRATPSSVGGFGSFDL